MKLDEIKTNYYIEPRYINIGDFHEGLALVENQKNLKGYINFEGIEVISCIFYDAHDFSDGLALIIQQDNAFFIDKLGKVQFNCPKKYKSINSFSNGLALVKENGKYGYINKFGKEVIPCIYEYATDFHEGLALVTYDINSNSSFFIDVDGKVQEQLKGDYYFNLLTSYFNNGLAMIYFKDRTCGYIDKNGHIIDTSNLKKDGQKKDCNLDITKRLINYCCEITCLGKVFKIVSSSEKELENEVKELKIFIMEILGKQNKLIGKK